jgi:hypothetical protein
MIILPDYNESVGEETKVAITILMLSFIMLLISVIIEQLRGFTLREIFTLNEDHWSSTLLIYTIISIIFFYLMVFLFILGALGHLIYGILY